MAGGILCLVVVLVLPVLPQFKDNQTIDSMLTGLLCNPGEHVQRTQSSEAGRRGGTNSKANVVCIDANENARDVEWRWVITGSGLFLVPFFIGLFFYRISKGHIPITFTTGTTDTLFSTQPNITSDSALSSRLQQIEQARQAGLISQEEYDRLRGQILNTHL